MSADQIKRYKAAFSKFDLNKDGKINKSEIEESFKAMGIKPRKGEIERIIKDGDKDGDGYVSWEEIEKSIKERPEKEHRDAQTRADLRVSFTQLDTNNDGYLTEQELRDNASNIPEDVINTMFTVADRNRDGKIHYDEFLKHF